jgi:hypothetical protein
MSTMELARQVDAALHEEEPESALHAVVRSLLSQGHSRLELVQALEGYRGQLASEGRDDDDELVLDIMAVLGGWASSTAVRNLLPPPCEAPQASSLS